VRNKGYLVDKLANSMIRVRQIFKEFVWWSSEGAKLIKFRFIVNLTLFAFAISWNAISSPLTFGTPVRLSDSVNSGFNEYAPCLSTDGRRLYFSSDRPDGFGSYDVYIAHRKSGVWQEATNVGPQINTEFEEGEPCLTSDDKLLYFYSSRRPVEDVESNFFVHNRGATHLRVAKVLKGGFGESWMLPESINASLHSNRPFISTDNRMLFFAAFGRAGNYGKWDVWASTISRGGYGIPYNLGVEINSSLRQSSASLSADGDHLYYAQQVEEESEWMGIRPAPMCAITVAKSDRGSFGNPVRTNIPIGVIDSAMMARDGSGIYYSLYSGDNYDIWFAPLTGAP